MGLTIPTLTKAASFLMTDPVVEGWMKNDVSGNFLFGQASPTGGSGMWELIEYKVLGPGEESFDFANCGTLDGDTDEMYMIYFNSLGPSISAEFLGTVASIAGGSSQLIGFGGGANGADDYYNGMRIRILAGAGSDCEGEDRLILDYNGTTKVATVLTGFSGLSGGRVLAIGDPFAIFTVAQGDPDMTVDIRINGSSVFAGGPSGRGTVNSLFQTHYSVHTLSTNTSAWRVAWAEPTTIGNTISLQGKVIMFAARLPGGVTTWNRGGISNARSGSAGGGAPRTQTSIQRWNNAGSSALQVTCLGATSNIGNLEGSEFWLYKKN